MDMVTVMDIVNQKLKSLGGKGSKEVRSPKLEVRS